MSGISLLESALRYAQKGLPVFPCNPANKQPFTSHGFKDATPNPEHIRAWWTVRPEAMIGLPTGEASGLWAVDCDGAEGLSEFLRRCEEHDYTPETLYQDTPSGGRHYLFAWPEEGGLGNRARMWPSVDVRGEGGYIVAAPSCREDGRRYAWGNRLAPAPAPAWLLQAARTKERSEGVKLNIGLSPASPGSPYGRKALEEEAAKVRSAPRGERNDALNRAAFSLFQLVAGGVLEEQEVQATLERAAEDCIPEDTMRRALLLADWVKENQLQTLALLKKEKARPSSPIECAIMKSLVADAERIEADGWKIANARLVEMVNGRLSVEVKPEQIGKAASALGLGACLVGEKRLRGRTVSPDKLDMFRATVSTVSPVSS